MNPSRSRSRGSAKLSRLCLNSKKPPDESSPTKKDISKYFIKTNSGTSSIDVESPFKNLTDVKVAINKDDRDDFKTPKPVKETRKVKANVTKRNTRNRSSLRQKTLKQVFAEKDTNAEHLQMAIAFSRSLEEHPDVLVFPSTQEVRQQTRGTLEQFGFFSLCPTSRTASEKLTKRTKKSRFHNQTPPLLSCTEDERQHKIQERVAEILSEPSASVVQTKHGDSQLHSKYLKRIQQSGAILEISFQLDSSRFYLHHLGFESSNFKCGSFLKKWEEIPGREISPERDLGCRDSGPMNCINKLTDCDGESRGITGDGLVVEVGECSRKNKVSEVISVEYNSEGFAKDNNLRDLNVDDRCEDTLKMIKQSVGLIQTDINKSDFVLNTEELNNRTRQEERQSKPCENTKDDSIYYVVTNQSLINNNEEEEIQIDDESIRVNKNEKKNIPSGDELFYELAKNQTEHDNFSNAHSINNLSKQMPLNNEKRQIEDGIDSDKTPTIIMKHSHLSSEESRNVANSTKVKSNVEESESDITNKGNLVHKNNIPESSSGEDNNFLNTVKVKYSNRSYSPDLFDSDDEYFDLEKKNSDISNTSDYETPIASTSKNTSLANVKKLIDSSLLQGKILSNGIGKTEIDEIIVLSDSDQEDNQPSISKLTKVNSESSKMYNALLDCETAKETGEAKVIVLADGNKSKRFFEQRIKSSPVLRRSTNQHSGESNLKPFFEQGLKSSPVLNRFVHQKSDDLNLNECTRNTLVSKLLQGTEENCSPILRSNKNKYVKSKTHSDFTKLNPIRKFMKSSSTSEVTELSPVLSKTKNRNLVRINHGNGSTNVLNNSLISKIEFNGNNDKSSFDKANKSSESNGICHFETFKDDELELTQKYLNSNIDCDATIDITTSSDEEVVEDKSVAVPLKRWSHYESDVSLNVTNFVNNLLDSNSTNRTSSLTKLKSNEDVKNGCSNENEGDAYENKNRSMSKHNSVDSIESSLSQESICISDEELNYSSIMSKSLANNRKSIARHDISDSDCSLIGKDLKTDWFKKAQDDESKKDSRMDVLLVQMEKGVDDYSQSLVRYDMSESDCSLIDGELKIKKVQEEKSQMEKGLEDNKRSLARYDMFESESSLIEGSLKNNHFISQVVEDKSRRSNSEADDEEVNVDVLLAEMENDLENINNLIVGCRRKSSSDEQKCEPFSSRNTVVENTVTSASKSNLNHLFDDTLAKMIDENSIGNLTNIQPSTSKDKTPTHKIVHPRLQAIHNAEPNIPDKSPAHNKPLQNSPRTPEDGIIVKTVGVTPMPNYDEMSTPKIVDELSKFGLKRLKRKRAVQMLKYIYESTHPSLQSMAMEENDDHAPTKRRKLILEKEEEKGARGEVAEDKQMEAKVPAGLGPDKFLHESEENMIFERKQLKSVSSCRLPLHIAWYNLIVSQPEILENILLYEPLQVEVLYSTFKSFGFRYHMEDLIKFLDIKCITFRINQNQKGKRSRF